MMKENSEHKGSGVGTIPSFSFFMEQFLLLFFLEQIGDHLKFWWNYVMYNFLVVQRKGKGSVVIEKLNLNLPSFITRCFKEKIDIDSQNI